MRKWLMRVAGLPMLAYTGICGWMYAQQRELMYYPQFTRDGVPPADFVVTRPDATLNGWVVNPGRPNAILYFGGNAESIHDRRDEFARWFPDSAVYLLPYRGYGPNDGSPSEAALFSDALALFDQVKSQQPEAQITVIGRSLGTGVASYVASQRPVSRVALITPFDSMVDVAQAHYPWLPVSWLVQDRYESVRHLESYAGPVLLIRAGKDRVIPPANTDRLIAALRRPPQVLELKDADHNSVGEHPAYAQVLSTFAATH